MAHRTPEHWPSPAVISTGRVVLHGKLLFEQDPGARVVWEAMTRKIYFDELPRLERAHREFAEAVLRRGG